jgi:hypothetical protein
VQEYPGQQRRFIGASNRFVSPEQREKKAYEEDQSGQAQELFGSGTDNFFDLDVASRKSPGQEEEETKAVSTGTNNV